MSNRTDQTARQIHGRNPQFLLETIIRNKIYNTLYWKEKCFALTSETIIDRAVELKYIGGTSGSSKQPSEFISLVLKMLQIQPSEEIIDEYLSDECAEYKYLRALAAFYVRLTSKSKDVYTKLEPLYNDFRKLRVRTADGSFVIMHMDEYIEELVNKESVFEVTMPPLTKRRVLELNGEINARVSILEADLDLDNAVAKLEEDYRQDEDDDYLKDVKLKDDFDKDFDKESQSDSDSSYNKRKKQKVEKVEKEEDNLNIDDIDAKLRLLNPNSSEYWLLMRKKIGINK